jgi:ribonucleoside-diphosphate reductase alpha chain
MISVAYSQELIDQLNRDIEQFPQVHPITPDMKHTFSGISRLVMIDRYSFKDTKLKTLKEKDFVVLTVKEDPKWPTRGFGIVQSIDWSNRTAVIQVEEEFLHALEGASAETGLVTRSLDMIEKPLELFYEQIAKRNATGLASVEKTEEKQKEWFEKFYGILKDQDFVPAGRVLHGAGSEANVTYFNCYVMPYPKDSREGIAEHRRMVMEIMSRGGGVGTNGSTLRPRNALARGVNGKSSGAVSWLDDTAKLTHLVEQGGSRRGAQMIMLAVWHPDIIEFIISKMQNPNILRFIIETTKDEQIKRLAKEKLKFEPLTPEEKDIYSIAAIQGNEYAKKKLQDGGTYTVHNPDFLTGANISVCLTKEFMDAVEFDLDFPLQFPAVEEYTEEEMNYYNEHWHEVGDVRDWEKTGLKVRTYRYIKARELWNLINICATYSAEPGIFFIDTANEMTNARAYGQKVVATNPCGEQPLAPMSVCNLSAVNLANMASFEAKEVDWEKLKRTVEIGVRLQDNIIDATPYFFEENKKQALGERRIGMGVMGLHDLLIKCGVRYGSEEGNKLIDKIFETIATTAYRASIELAKEKGSFPFLTHEDKEKELDLRMAFINTGYMKNMPKDIRQDILKYGIRNSHLLTVAPTGSTGTMIGCSTGLEPYFAFTYYRSGRLGKFIEVKAPIVEEYLKYHPEADPDHLPDFFVSAMELTPEEHADVQCIIQRWVDSSLSKTVNAPKGYTVQQVQTIYERLYKGGAKGGTVYVDGSRDAQVLSLSAEENNLDEIDVKLKNEETPKEEERKIGTEVGNICPICKIGTVTEAGGCHTCDNCQAQLKCGL